jgi:DNA repair protein RadC
MEYSQLSNLELLQLAIGIRGAKRLYRGTLEPLFAPERPANRHHRKLAAATELHRRWLKENLRDKDAMSSPSQVRDYLFVFFAGQGYESFVTLFLDMQNRLIAAEELFRGTLSQTSVYPREIVKRALATNAGGVIFAHNHPSGVCEPSRADELLTQTLKQALSLVEVRVLDHIVVAGDKAMSFAERGLI